MTYAGFIDQRQVSKTAEFSDGFAKVNRHLGNIVLVVTFPFFMLILWVVQSLLSKSNKGLEKALVLLKSEEGHFPVDAFGELQDLYEYTADLLLNQNLIRDDVAENGDWYLAKFRKKFMRFTINLEEIQSTLHRSLYVEASNFSLSDAQQAELDGFFGTDEDYQEDTFIQLNSNG